MLELCLGVLEKSGYDVSARPLLVLLLYLLPCLCFISTLAHDGVYLQVCSSVREISVRIDSDETLDPFIYMLSPISKAESSTVELGTVHIDPDWRRTQRPRNQGVAHDGDQHLRWS